jgi:hypothetical protein
MSYSRHRRDHRYSNLLLIPDLRAFVQCITVNVRFLLSSWNGFLRLAGTRHTSQARYSRQVYALMIKLKTLYYERFLVESFQCESAIKRPKISEVPSKCFNSYTPPTDFLRYLYEAPSKYNDNVPYTTQNLRYFCLIGLQLHIYFKH